MNDSTPYGPGFANAQAAYDHAEPPEPREPEPEPITDTAYLDLRVWTPSVLWSDFYDEEPDAVTRDEFRHEIERAVVTAVGKLLNLRRIDVESAWYFSARPCPELVGVQHEDQCGEPTRREHQPYGLDRGVYRVCGYGHKTPADPVAQQGRAS